MEQLILSSDLFVMQVEMDVYTALKKVQRRVAYVVATTFAHCRFRPVSHFRPLCAVDVFADQPIMGRSHEAASG